jgi:hypothetical protein
MDNGSQVLYCRKNAAGDFLNIVLLKLLHGYVFNLSHLRAYVGRFLLGRACGDRS